MRTKWIEVAVASMGLLVYGCAVKQVQAPPPAPHQPKESLIVLLPDSEGKPSGIAVTNSAGAQTLTEPYQAVRVQRSDAAPSPPFAIDQAEVRRVFGPVLDALPAPEAVFTFYFDLEKDELLAADQAKLPAILDAIRERRSTAISLIGHADTTADSKHNNQLGLLRAQRVAALLRARGVDSAGLFVASHGDADPAV